MMKYLKILLFFNISLVAQFLTAQDEAVFASEQARFSAQIALDTTALDGLLAEELIYIHSNTLTENKADFIKSVQSGKIVYQTMKLQSHQLRRYRKIAVITGLVEVAGLYEGYHFTVELYYTSIYRKHKKDWLLLSWQSTSKK